MELRTILDWEVARPLKSVPGVVEVNAFGGELKTYEVELDPDRLLGPRDLVNQVFEAIRRNNGNAGGGYIQRNGELRVIRGVGPDQRASKDLEEVVLDDHARRARRSTSATWATVRFAPMIRQGAVTRDGRGEAVTAIVLLLAGENGRVVVDRIKEKVDGDPEDAARGGRHRRRTTTAATLIEKTIATVARNLAEGGVLVIAVLLVLLGNLRAGLIVAAGDPAVDALRRQPDALLRHRRQPDEPGRDRLRPDRRQRGDRDRELRQPPVARRPGASGRRRRPPGDAGGPQAGRLRRGDHHAWSTCRSWPCEGVEGKMFRPMALTVIFALTGSLLLSLTATPVLASFFLKPGIVRARHAGRSGWAKRVYEPVLRCVAAAPGRRRARRPLAGFAACVPVALRLGRRVHPPARRGRPRHRPDPAPRAPRSTRAIADSTRLEKALREAFPDEIRTVVSRIGRPEIGLEPAGVNMTDTWVLLNEPGATGPRPTPRTS